MLSKGRHRVLIMFPFVFFPFGDPGVPGSGNLHHRDKKGMDIMFESPSMTPMRLCRYMHPGAASLGPIISLPLSAIFPGKTITGLPG